MYPQPELKALAARKAALIGELDRGRAELGAAAGRVLAPLELVGRLWLLGRQAVRLVGSLPAREPPARGPAPAPRASAIRRWLRWLPFAVAASRLVRGCIGRPTDGASAGPRAPGRGR
jgi:hypothetical protein